MRSEYSQDYFKFSKEVRIAGFIANGDGTVKILCRDMENSDFLLT